VANRRMISKSISTSRRFGELRTDFQRLLYLMLIPHTDDFGRIDGTPYHIRHCIVPTLRRSEKQIIDALIVLGEVGLIRWYRTDEQITIQITNFDEHQTGLHKRTESAWLSYEDAESMPGFEDLAPESEKFREIPGNSRLIELNRTEQN